jgi:DNA-3-methyladenine glycosylase
VTSAPGRPASVGALLAGPVLAVAPALLGAVLLHRTAAGVVGVRLTEVEAYGGPDDPGSHARAGRTARTQVMFGPPARLYVYLSHGVHWCANLVCGPDGTAGAVLLRAGEVVRGVPLARTRRPAVRRDVDLARGPGRLASALGLVGADDGAVVGGSRADTPTRLLLPGAVAGPVRWGPRVGVSGPGGDGDHYPWRCWLDGDPTVSPYRRVVRPLPAAAPPDAEPGRRPPR